MSQLKVTGMRAGVTLVDKLSDEMRAAVVAEFGEQARFWLIARDGRCYVLTTQVDDPEDGTEAWWTGTAYEVEDVHGSIVAGQVASRQRVSLGDAVARVIEAHGRDIPDDEAHRLIDESFRALKVEAFDAICDAVDIPGAGAKGIVYPVGATRKADPSTADLIAEAWPDDTWSGTVSDVVALVRDAGWEVNADSVKRALQRGDYAATEVPGKASVWRRQRATERGPKRA